MAEPAETTRQNDARGGHPAIALALLVPVPTTGVYFGMWNEVTAGTALGQAIYMAGKAWILLLPAVWLLFIERGRLSWSPPRRGGLLFGAISGIILSAIIVAAYLLLGRDLIDQQNVRDAAAQAGIDVAWRYLALAAYICTINAVLEEYVWRWFCYRQCERLAPALGGWIAVMLSALFFTIHHVFALAAQFDWPVVVLGSLGVFFGGAFWSWCYRRYRSIWPGFISHAIVDVAIFVIGWRLIFGG